MTRSPKSRGFRLLYRTDLSLECALAEIEKKLPSDAAREIIRFVRESKRGIVRRSGDEDADDE